MTDGGDSWLSAEWFLCIRQLAVGQKYSFTVSNQPVQAALHFVVTSLDNRFKVLDGSSLPR